MINLDKAVSLFSDADRARQFISKYKETTRPSDVDKHGLKFVKGRSDRFVSQQLTMFLECYKGYYGNSSCSTISLGRNSKEIEDAFVRWANKNMQLILNGIADELEVQATTLKVQCENELKAAQDKYNTLFGE